ncbi:hypothetical protein [Teichococcus aestuarii]|uniref:hypothetical protein n=1 Tax=Teichococcus aestuarii TaxID=568898 RepID=UPI0036198A34
MIGMDHYWKHQWETTNPDTAWGKIYNARFGLKWQADFADQRGKLKEASEWAIPGDTKVGRSYLQRMRQHFIDREYCAAGYWDSEKDTNGRLSDNPAGDDSRKAFVELFGLTYLPAKSGTGDHPQPSNPAPVPTPSSPRRSSLRSRPTRCRRSCRPSTRAPGLSAAAIRPRHWPRWSTSPGLRG